MFLREWRSWLQSGLRTPAHGFSIPLSCQGQLQQPITHTSPAFFMPSLLLIAASPLSKDGPRLYHRLSAQAACNMQVAQHITAIQQRAAVLGSGPPEWAVSAKCQARAGPNEKWGRAVIEGISPSGRFLVEGLPSARESCHEVSKH